MSGLIFKKRILLLLGLGCFLLCAPAAAQSGRQRGTAAPTPSPTPTATPSNLQDQQPSEPVVRPASIIISGSTTSDTGGYHSSDVSTATDEIIDMFKLFRLPCKPIKGGKMTKQEAIERAKKETDAYVLWLQIAVKTDIYAIEGVVLDRVYYILFLPVSGKVLFQGEIDPKNIVQTNEQGTRTPPMTRTRSRMMDPYLRASAREVFRRVRGRIY